MESILTFLRQLFPAPCHGRILVVGGSVRDFLLGRECQDIDLIAAVPHAELVALGFRLVQAKSAATIYFKYHHSFGKIEVTQLASMADVDGDLLRRDFTINALAMDFSGNVIDPLGGGADVTSGLLRPCSQRAFEDDPLRIFRAFRFEADGWRMLPECEALIRSYDWHDELTAIPVERFSHEMLKALALTVPERFFERMLAFHVGENWLPELFRMPHVPAGPREHHPEGDLFTHAIQVLQRVAVRSSDPLARFCALFHDIGKLATAPALYPKHHGHDETGFEMAELFCQRLCLPASYRKALAWISRLHGKANRWDQLRDSSKLKMAEQAIKAGIAQILPLVSAADKPGNQRMSGWDTAVRIAAMNSQELGIDQKQLQALPAEKRPAFMLQRRVEAWRGQKQRGAA